jgi:regulatory protein
MRITKIESPASRPGRKNIFADDRLLASISEETLLRTGLSTGDELSESALQELIREEETSSARRVAIQYLARRPRTSKEIRDKLRTNQFTDADINTTIESLERAGLVNDAGFAGMYIRDALSARAMGKLLLKRKLLLLGIEKETVEHALDEAFADVDEKAAALKAGRTFMKKSAAIRKAARPDQLRNRLASFLGRRGYTWDVVGPVVRELMGEGDE